MYGINSLTEAIYEIGFSCLRCGACCQGGKDEHCVIVSPPEIDAIEHATGMERSDIVQPYPEYIESDGGRKYTFAWCLRNHRARCIFLGEGKTCIVYQMRPWICRTYPFALNEDGLTISQCPGLGREMSRTEAGSLAVSLLQRRDAEHVEEKKVEAVFSRSDIPEHTMVVFDSRGMWSVYG